MVTVQFNFKTILEAQEFLASMPQPLFVESARAANPTATEVTTLLKESVKSGPDGAKIFEAQVDAIIASAAKNDSEKKKRGPKPKAEPAKEYDIEDCRTALSSLFDVKGREVAKSVLTEFKVDRVTYLKPEQFGAFIDRCNAAGKPE